MGRATIPLSLRENQRCCLTSPSPSHSPFPRSLLMPYQPRGGGGRGGGRGLCGESGGEGLARLVRAYLSRSRQIYIPFPCSSGLMPKVRLPPSGLCPTASPPPWGAGAASLLQVGMCRWPRPVLVSLVGPPPSTRGCPVTTAGS